MELLKKVKISNFIEAMALKNIVKLWVTYCLQSFVISHSFYVGKNNILEKYTLFTMKNHKST